MQEIKEKIDKNTNDLYMANVPNVVKKYDIKRQLYFDSNFMHLSDQ